MSTNKNKNTGLRFLWIPGRKKHQHKGRYDTTNKQQLHSNHQPKKNEIWSLGGSKGHEEIIKATDIPVDIACSSTSATVAALPTVTAVIASTTAANKMMENPLVNDDLEGLHHRDEDETGDADGIHNTGTLIMGEHKSHHQNGIAKHLLNQSGDFIMSDENTLLIIDPKQFDNNSIIDNTTITNTAITKTTNTKTTSTNNKNNINNNNHNNNINHNNNLMNHIQNSDLYQQQQKPPINYLDDLPHVPWQQLRNGSDIQMNNSHFQDDINSIKKHDAAITDLSADNSITAIDDDDDPQSSSAGGSGGGAMMLISDDDDVDASKIGFLKHSGIVSYDKNGKHKQLEHHQQQQQQQQQLHELQQHQQKQRIDKEPDEKTVDCLYYAVKCCECSIS